MTMSTNCEEPSSVGLHRPDYERLSRMSALGREIEELLDQYGEGVYQNRVIALALSKLVDAFGVNAARVSRRSKRLLPLIHWGRLVVLSNCLPQVRSNVSPANLKRVTEQQVLPALPAIRQALDQVQALDSEPIRPINSIRRVTSLFDPVEDAGAYKRAFRNVQFGCRKFSSDAVPHLSDSHYYGYAAYRTLIDVWFQSLPELHRKEMHGRINCCEERTHLPAIDELYLHTFFLEQGWAVEKDPQIGIYRPDFHVRSGDTSWYCELLTLFPSDETSEARRQLENLLRHLDGIDSDWLLGVHLQKDSTCIDSGAVTGRVYDWLQSLHPQAGVFYSLRLQESGFEGEIVAYRRRRTITPGCIYDWSLPLDDRSLMAQRIKRGVRKKMKTYGFVKELGEPFVLAISTRENWSFDDTNLYESMYGDCSLTLKNGSRFLTIPEITRFGYFNREYNTRVSAIIVLEKIWNRIKMEYNLKVLHNPWAAQPLSPETFSSLPQLIPTQKSAGETRLLWHNLPGRTMQI